ncbi:MAG: hypothetical protein ABIN89_09960 [Chitinophagaceae bacterium]
MPNTPDVFDNEEPIHEAGINYSEGSILASTPDGGYVNINPEYMPYKNSIITSGKFHVYCVHATHGSSSFYIEQDNHNRWKYLRSIRHGSKTTLLVG